MPLPLPPPLSYSCPLRSRIHWTRTRRLGTERCPTPSRAVLAILRHRQVHTILRTRKTEWNPPPRAAPGHRSLHLLAPRSPSLARSGAPAQDAQRQSGRSGPGCCRSSVRTSGRGPPLRQGSILCDGVMEFPAQPMTGPCGLWEGGDGMRWG